jgi:hypothetical protein
MDETQARLTARVAELGEALRSLEVRVRALEMPDGNPTSNGPVRSAAPAPLLPALALEPLAPGVSLPAAAALAGRAVLALGGAFLARTLTDTGVLPHGAGVALGLVYALAWVFLADRSARAGNRVRSAADALTATVIVCPLVWEATTRLHVLSSGEAALLLGLYALLGLGLAVVRRLLVAAWLTLLGVLAAGFVLLVTTQALATYVALFLVLGALSLAASVSRSGRSLPWAPAIAVDLVVLQAGLIMGRPGGPPEEYTGVSPGAVAALAVALALLYLAATAWRTLGRREEPTPFDWIQTPLALSIGIGTAVWIGPHAGISAAAIGAGVCAAAAALYAVSFAQKTAPRTAVLHTTLALVLALAGIGLAVPEGARFALLSALGIAAAFVASRGSGPMAAAHSALFLLAAAFTGGLSDAASNAFVATRAADPASFSAPVAVVFASSAIAFVLVTAAPGRGESLLSRLPALVLGILGALGTGALAETALERVAAPRGDPGAVAATRTAVLAAAALLLALCRRRPRLFELSWLVYPILALGVLKLVADDLPHGRPATLFIAFALYGLALVAAPRLLKAPPHPTATQEEET